MWPYSFNSQVNVWVQFVYIHLLIRCEAQSMTYMRCQDLTMSDLCTSAGTKVTALVRKPVHAGQLCRISAQKPSCRSLLSWIEIFYVFSFLDSAAWTPLKCCRVGSPWLAVTAKVSHSRWTHGAVHLAHFFFYIESYGNPSKWSYTVHHVQELVLMAVYCISQTTGNAHHFFFMCIHICIWQQCSKLWLIFNVCIFQTHTHILHPLIDKYVFCNSL